MLLEAHIFDCVTCGDEAHLTLLRCRRIKYRSETEYQEKVEEAEEFELSTQCQLLRFYSIPGARSFPPLCTVSLTSKMHGVNKIFLDCVAIHPVTPLSSGDEQKCQDQEGASQGSLLEALPQSLQGQCLGKIESFCSRVWCPPLSLAESC